MFIKNLKCFCFWNLDLLISHKNLVGKQQLKHILTNLVIHMHRILIYRERWKYMEKCKYLRTSVTHKNYIYEV
jgi:hypothetical protein